MEIFIHFLIRNVPRGLDNYTVQETEMADPFEDDDDMKADLNDDDPFSRKLSH